MHIPFMYLTYMYMYMYINRGVMEMWKGLLDKTDELGKRRGTVGDLLAGSISDDLKRLKRSKEQNYKRQSDILQLMISEVLDSVRELTTVSAMRERETRGEGKRT